MRRTAAALVTLLVSACALAAAASTSAAAPLPFLAIDCKQDVSALQGQPIVLSRLAVSGQVGDAIKATAKTLPAANGLAGATAFNLGLPLAVGTVGGHDSAVPGAAIADAVVTAAASLPQFASNKDAGLAALREAVTQSCGMTVHPLGSATDDDSDTGTTATTGPTGPDDPSAVTPAAGYRNPDQLWLYTPAILTGRAPQRDYGDLPAAAPGAWSPSPALRYGDGVPGYTPQFGLIGARDDTAMRTAGDAQALPLTSSGDIGLPVLLAVLALSVVTGTLVRTWVLRRA